MSLGQKDDIENKLILFETNFNLNEMIFRCPKNKTLAQDKLHSSKIFQISNWRLGHWIKNFNVKKTSQSFSHYKYIFLF